MRRLIAIFLSLFLTPGLGAGTAAAQCAGNDLLVGLRGSDPQAHADLFRRAHAEPNPQGKFWRVERGGAPPSYLFGTFHDTGIASEPLDPAVASALTGARLMLVEVTEEEQAAMQARMTTDPGFIMDLSRSGLSARLTDDERVTAGRKLAKRGLTLPIADKMRPWMLFSLLAVPHCMMVEAQAGKPTLDTLLVQKAGTAGVPVDGLETYEQAIASIAGIPAPLMDEILLEMLRDISAEEDARETTVGLYRAGETAAIWEFSVTEASKTLGPQRSADVFGRFRELLLDTRNRAWMKALVPELAHGGVFAAFGALHLPGETGVIELLRAEGFTVTRLD